ncbi:MAG: hypothetical protein ACXVRE_12015 [Gaiellaceae bacterium]
MSQALVRAAARNNAEWCAAFCRTHGIAGRFRRHSWFSPVRTPPYYPDAVTLLPEAAAEQILAGVDTGEGCSVKDSFAGLDLAPFGFAPLFRAEWVVREPAEARPAAGRWSALTRKEQLSEWEAAWGESPEGSDFFRGALLEDETIAVLAEYDGDRIVAGAVANRSATVIGLSNLFHAAGDLESAWAGGTAAATALWGAMPAVGYESGAALDAAHRAGFESIGELVVWLS